MLEWARQNGCRWDERTCSAAAGRGHLAVLQWARHNGCSWGADTCTEAADGGHLPVLQWAREHNCPWSAYTSLHAAIHDHLDTVRWAWQQQPSCPWWSLDELSYDEASHGRRLSDVKPRTLLWLAQQGAPLSDQAYAIACSSADWLTHAYMALQALLPADVLNHNLTLSIE